MQINQSSSNDSNECFVAIGSDGIGVVCLWRGGSGGTGRARSSAVVCRKQNL
jgi:hypothetical protein